MALYSLSVSILAANAVTYCGIPLHEGKIVGGAAQLIPTSAQLTYVSFQGNTIALYMPPGDAQAGATVDADSTIAGLMTVSPPLATGVTVVAYGRGKVLGTYTLPAGEMSGSFSFNVSGSAAFESSEEALGAAVKRGV